MFVSLAAGVVPLSLVLADYDDVSFAKVGDTKKWALDIQKYSHENNSCPSISNDSNTSWNVFF